MRSEVRRAEKRMGGSVVSTQVDEQPGCLCGRSACEGRVQVLSGMRDRVSHFRIPRRGWAPGEDEWGEQMEDPQSGEVRAMDGPRKGNIAGGGKKG